MTLFDELKKMQKNENVYTALIRDIDKAIAKLKPLGEHLAATQDEHVRERYAVVLAAIVLMEGEVSETRARLLGMLVQALGLESSLASLFEQAQLLDTDGVFESLRLIRSQGIRESFLLDVMILLRLDAALTDEQSALLSGLFQALDMSDEEVPVMAYWVSLILGLTGSYEISEKLFRSVKVSKESTLNPVLESFFYPFRNKKLVVKYLIGPNSFVGQGECFAKIVEIGPRGGILSELSKIVMPQDGIITEHCLSSDENIKCGLKVLSFLPIPAYTSAWHEFLKVTP